MSKRQLWVVELWRNKEWTAGEAWPLRSRAAANAQLSRINQGFKTRVVKYVPEEESKGREEKR